jgi:hypothetical protein
VQACFSWVSPLLVSTQSSDQPVCVAETALKDNGGKQVRNCAHLPFNTDLLSLAARWQHTCPACILNHTPAWLAAVCLLNRADCSTWCSP